VQALISDGKIKVDAYGCLRNQPAPLPNDAGPHYASRDDIKISVIKDYLFDLAFENSHCEEYITEKVWQPLSVGVIPVYYGTRFIKDLLPDPNAVVYVSDFHSASDLGDYLKKMALPENSELVYDRHLKWRDASPDTWSKRFWEAYHYSRWIHSERNLDCLLCQTVVRLQQERLSAHTGPRCMKAGIYPPCNTAADRHFMR
jgi:hypothetical protein